VGEADSLFHISRKSKTFTIFSLRNIATSV
jgi:hypothetical protein